MAVLRPEGVDSTSGQPLIGGNVDQLQTDLAGATVNGHITRRSQGNYVAGGDYIIIQKTFADFAVAGTTATSLLLTLPGNSFVDQANVYIEVTGDSVATLTIGIKEPIGGMYAISGVDGLTASTVAWTTAHITTGDLAAGPFDLVAELVSTGGNLDTMSQGVFDFAISYVTAK